MANDNLFRMNLQLFAEGEAAEAEAQQETQQQEETQQETQQERRYTQAEVDAAIANRVSRVNRDVEKRIEEAKKAARYEAEKLAKMNAEQRAEHDRQEAENAAKEREAAIAKREAEITRRELRAEAIDTLHKRGLPTGLEAVLSYSDAESCAASIDAVEKVFREAVQQGVNDRLKQSGVSVRAGSTPDYAKMSDADYYAATYKPGGKK